MKNKRKHIPTLLLATSVIIASNSSIVLAKTEKNDKSSTSCTFAINVFKKATAEQKTELYKKIDLSKIDKNFKETEVLLSPSGSYKILGNTANEKGTPAIGVVFISADYSHTQINLIKNSENKNLLKVTPMYDDTYVIAYEDTSTGEFKLERLDVIEDILWAANLNVKNVSDITISPDNKKIFVEHTKSIEGESKTMIDEFTVKGEFIASKEKTAEFNVALKAKSATIQATHTYKGGGDVLNNRGTEVTITATDPAGIKKITDPSGAETMGHTATYFANDNGTYKFTVENTNGDTLEYPVIVSNIDKDAPTLTIKSDYDAESKGVKYTITASDDFSGIKYILLPDGTMVGANKAEYVTTEPGEFTFKAFDNVCNRAMETIKLDAIPDEPTPPPTEDPTDPPTEKPDEKPTPPTEKPTDPPTEKPKEPPTEKPTPPTETPSDIEKDNPQTGDEGIQLYLLGAIGSLTALSGAAIYYRVQQKKKGLNKNIDITKK